MTNDSINVLLLCGGGSSEHDISLVSAQFFDNILSKIPRVKRYFLRMDGGGETQDEKGERRDIKGYLASPGGDVPLHYAIACIHGYPGESGHIQGLFDSIHLPYFGASVEACALCFNKISTKIWLNTIGIPNTPFLFVEKADTDDTLFFLRKHKKIFIKPSSQGSSIGCHFVSQECEVDKALKEALALSPFALVEKAIEGRELEVAVFNYRGKNRVTLPGEILCSKKFYSYSEKYDPSSSARTKVPADLPAHLQRQIQHYALRAFEIMRIKDLARIDFFLSEEQDIYLNEINTMPGHTPISMFPMMLEHHGISYRSFLEERIYSGYRRVA